VLNYIFSAFFTELQAIAQSHHADVEKERKERCFHLFCVLLTKYLKLDTFLRNKFIWLIILVVEKSKSMALASDKGSPGFVAIWKHGKRRSHVQRESEQGLCKSLLSPELTWFCEEETTLVSSKGRSPITNYFPPLFLLKSHHFALGTRLPAQESFGGCIQITSKP
jgi:hypothetical protein